MTEKIKWDFRLYIAGQSTKSINAQSNLKQICEKHLKELYTIQVIDLLNHPELAAADQIVAIPTLVRMSPLPVKKYVGDLSAHDQVISRLEVPL